MYRTQTQKFSVASNIDLSVVNEIKEGNSCYSLLKISLLGRNTYCICVLSNGYALESIGESDKDALELFELVVSQAPAAEHIFDIVTDFRRQKELQEYWKTIKNQ